MNVEYPYEELLKRFGRQTGFFRATLVSETPELWTLKKSLSFMSEQISVFRVEANETWPIHVDVNSRGRVDRRSVLNLPLFVSPFDADTVYYRALVDRTDDADPRYRQFYPQDVEEIERFSVDGPTIMDVTVPHSVINKENRPRLMLSWGCGLVYEELKWQMRSFSVDIPKSGSAQSLPGPSS